MQPFLEVFLWALVISLVTVFIQRLLTKPKEIREIKKELKFYQEKMKEAQKSGDMGKAKKYMDDMFKVNQKIFRHNMKPLMVTFLVVIIILAWMNQKYVGVLVNLPFNAPFAGSDVSWFWWYVLTTLPATWIFRKALGVE